MEKGKTWFPVPYYYTGPLSKVAVPSNKLPHKLGFIPKFLEKRNQIKIDPKKEQDPQT